MDKQNYVNHTKNGDVTFTPHSEYRRQRSAAHEQSGSLAMKIMKTKHEDQRKYGMKKNLPLKNLCADFHNKICSVSYEARNDEMYPKKTKRLHSI